jgi:site-specific DNA recombinase
MRAAIYARVSTSNHGQDPHVQTRELREHCQRRGWEIADEYVDNGISGTKERRPQLDRSWPIAGAGASILCWCIATTDSLAACAT